MLAVHLSCEPQSCQDTRHLSRCVHCTCTINGKLRLIRSCCSVAWPKGALLQRKWSQQRYKWRASVLLRGGTICWTLWVLHNSGCHCDDFFARPRIFGEQTTRMTRRGRLCLRELRVKQKKGPGNSLSDAGYQSGWREWGGRGRGWSKTCWVHGSLLQHCSGWPADDVLTSDGHSQELKKNCAECTKKKKDWSMYWMYQGKKDWSMYWMYQGKKRLEYHSGNRYETPVFSFLDTVSTIYLWRW